ncbi:MAG: esterase/lipase family protein [Planctomycetota bacterium]|jgi:pimeloyl-ACP methyl ester carboxylesterase
MRIIALTIMLFLLTAPSDVLRIEVPLEDGHADAAEILVQLCEAAGLPAPGGLEGRHWPLDVSSRLDRLQLEALELATLGALDIEIDKEHLVLAIDRKRLDAVRARLAARLETWTGSVRGEPSKTGHGLWFATRDQGQAPLSALPEPPPHAVILVHGLDDPGWMWRDMVPAIRDAGYAVARFEYPNDGPISDGADHLALELARLRAGGVRRVDLVAHSMGGLVCRDVLTRSAYYRGDGSGGDRFPAADTLIMIGTPNGGSHWARLRGFSELGEHLSRAWRGESGWLDAAADGSGEAGEDLLPGSVFLRRLNGRPHPTHTRYTIVAGQVSPVSGDDLDRTLGKMKTVKIVPQWLRDLANGAEGELAASALGAAIGGIGDGVVTLDSARLEGVDDLVIVQADHVGMIVNVGGSQDPPPTIEIVLDRLARE